MGKNDIRMREKLKNELYSEILFKINNRSVSVTAFSEEFDKSRISLRDNILALEKDNYLIREDKGKLKYFTINWKRIIKEFLHYLKERNKIEYNKIDKSLLKNITKNKILQEYFKQYFFMYWKRAITQEWTGNKTVYGFFMDSLYLTNEDFIKGLLDEASTEVAEFLNFIKLWRGFYFRNLEFVHSQPEVLQKLEYKFAKYGESCKREKRNKRIKELEPKLKELKELIKKKKKGFERKLKKHKNPDYSEFESFDLKLNKLIKAKDPDGFYKEQETLEGWNANEDFKKEENKLLEKEKSIKTDSITI